MLDLNTVLETDLPARHNSLLDDLDPDNNLFKSNSDCIYYNEDSFKELVNSKQLASNGMSVMHLNIRSAPKNIACLENYLKCLNFDFTVIGLSETWHNENTVKIYEIKDYYSISKFRSDRKGGGVSLYIKSTLEWLDVLILNYVVLMLSVSLLN